MSKVIDGFQAPSTSKGLTAEPKFSQVEKRNLSRYFHIVDNEKDFLHSLSSALPRTGWINTMKIDVDSLTNQGWLAEGQFHHLSWRKNGVRFTGDSQVGKSLAYDLGLIHIQEEASMLPVEVLQPQPGERILDLCAAPGNKTAEIAVKMTNRGTLIANDIDPTRIRSLKISANRLGLLNLVTTVRDGRDFQGENNYFDRTLIDAPCSCEGTYRKNKTALSHNIQPFEPFANGLQIGLLNRAIRATKPGGLVVYSTCTFRPEENEAVVDSILKKQDVELEPVSIPSFKFTAGILQWGKRQFHPSIKHTARIWPHHNDTSGFFIAKLRKRGPSD